jgi:hypothetical protein
MSPIIRILFFIFSILLLFTWSTDNTRRRITITLPIRPSNNPKTDSILSIQTPDIPKMRRRPYQPDLPQTPGLIPRTLQIPAVLLLRPSRILGLLVVGQQQRSLFRCGQVREASLVGGAELREVRLQR